MEMNLYDERLEHFSVALADPTRREIMHFIMQSEEPLSVREIAEHFHLHANAARMHLDKLVKGGLLKTIRRRDNRGGRPAHLYCVSEEERELQIPQRRYRLLAEVLAQWVSEMPWSDFPEVSEKAFKHGREEALRFSTSIAYLRHGAPESEILKAWAEESKANGQKVKIGRLDGNGQGEALIFLSCPFGELSRRYPGPVCEIHRCIEEGLLSLAGGWQVKVEKNESACAFILEKKKIIR